MLPDLVSALRCIHPHEDSWLVAAAYRVDGGHIVEGVLGCPVCQAQYPVRSGVADFTGGASLPQGAGEAADPGAADPGAADPAEEAVRLAALLELAEPRLPVVLGGTWGGLLPVLDQVVPAATWLLVNAAPAPAGPSASGLRVVGTLPLAPGAAHGVALDEATAADRGLLAGAARALRPGGRLVAPAAAPLPDGVRELARDARHWVAERVVEPVTTPPQPLLRRR